MDEQPIHSLASDAVREDDSSPLSHEESAQIVRAASHELHQQIMHSGPLPSPETLAGYEQVLPGAAERILHMAEQQQDHRQVIEKAVVFGNVRDQRLGVVFAFLLGVAGISCGTAIILLGHPLGGFSVLLAALASLVTAFIYGRHEQRKEREAAQAREDD